MPITVLSELERRVLANLSIPRNLRNLGVMLLGDPHSPYGPAVTDEQLRVGGSRGTPDDLVKLMEELERLGLVVNLGSFEDAGRLAAVVVDGKNGSLPYHEDERAENLVRVLGTEEQAYRLLDDQWMLTTEGLEKLREPVGPSKAMTPSEVEALIMKHVLAIKELPLEGSIHDEDGGTIPAGIAAKEPLGRGEVDPDDPGRPVATLLPEEFSNWVKIISDDCEARWGVRPKVPIAGGNYFNATEDLIQAADAGGTAYGETSPTYFGLSILAFTDTDTGTTADDGSHLPTYTGYARKSVTSADLGTSSTGTRTNANAIVWAGATAGSSTIVGAGRFTTLTGGRGIRYLPVASVTVSATQTPAQIAAGALTDTLN